MTIITSIVISDALLKNGEEQFENEEDEIEFEKIHQLYTTNHLIVKEFA